MTSDLKKRCYIIAEAGVNHNGSLDMARQLIDVAKRAGADAVKFQTFKADKLVSRSTPKAEYQLRQTDASESQYEMIKKLELSEKSHYELIAYCKKVQIEFLSTPFDEDSVKLLAHDLDLPRLKISSGDLTNALLLLASARTGKPVIISTGMATLGEVERALSVLAFGYLNVEGSPSKKAFHEAYCSAEGQRALLEKVAVLHCTTEYPAPFGEINLNAMGTLRAAFGLSVGFSDHSEGISVPIAAVAMGAKVIEKHFTLDRNLPGPDHKASLEPEELVAMVRSIREVERALGSGLKQPALSEIKNVAIARKSLVAAVDIRAGELYTAENISIKRPGDGISPFDYWELLGKVALKDQLKDKLIS